MPVALPDTIVPAADADSQCGRCGYCVRGLDGPVCPECGADLRVVGVTTPAARRRRRLRPWAWAILWTLALPGPAIVVTVLLQRFVAPHVYEASGGRVIFVQAPYLDATVRVEVQGRETRWGGVDRLRNVPLRHMALELVTPASKAGRLHVDLGAGTCRITDPFGRPLGSRPFTAEAVLAWLALAGFDPGDPRAASRARDVHTAAVETTATPPPSFTMLGDRQTDAAGPATTVPLVTAHPAYAYMLHQPVEWFYPGAAGAWLLLWVAGLWLIIRRARRSRALPARRDEPPVRPGAVQEGSRPSPG